MRKLIIFLCAILLSPLLNYAQQPVDSALQLQSYVFDGFVDGSVLSKSGEINYAALNYCAFDQSILFKQDGKVMTLTGLDAIDTIFIAKKKYVPFKNAVYEVVDTGKVQLYLSYTSKMHPWEATTDHNGTYLTNSKAVSNTVSNVYISRPYKGEFSIEITKSYWLKSYNKLYKAYNERDFTKVFKEHTSPSINEFIKEKKINFNAERDLVMLVDFCNKQ